MSWQRFFGADLPPRLDAERESAIALRMPGAFFGYQPYERSLFIRQHGSPPGRCVLRLDFSIEANDSQSRQRFSRSRENDSSLAHGPTNRRSALPESS